MQNDTEYPLIPRTFKGSVRQFLAASAIGTAALATQTDTFNKYAPPEWDRAIGALQLPALASACLFGAAGILGAFLNRKEENAPKP